MLDLFNKQKLREKELEIDRAKQKNNSLISEIASLNEKLNEIKVHVAEIEQINQDQKEESKAQLKALEMFLTEFAAFIVNNKSKKLDYDSVVSARPMIDSLIDLNEYHVSFDIECVNIKARMLSLMFNQQIEGSSHINSHIFKVDTPIVLTSYHERYLGIVKIFSSGSFDLVKNLIYQILYNSKVSNIEFKLQNDGVLSFKGLRKVSFIDYPI